MPTIEQLPFTTDAGIGRARIGLVTLATDQTIEDEFRRIVPAAGGAVYHTRLWNDAAINEQTLRAIEGRISPAARLLLPGVGMDVVAFGCTSASMVIGSDRVEALVHESLPGCRVTTPLRATVAALQACGARRVALLTPYVKSVNDGIRSWLENEGFTVPATGSFSESDDLVVARIDAASVLAAGTRLLKEEDCDALFVSCTSIRILEVVEPLERLSGAMVTSSNHAMAWHALRLARLPTQGAGPGRLYSLPA